jgi:hypothetical protein
VNDQSQEGFPALVIAGGPRNGESLLLDTPGLEKVLGSGADCHLRFAGSSVDYHHAGVFWDEAAGVLINDQGSATGTWVNGERVGSPRVLQDGDRISLGPPGSAESVKLLVQIPPQFEAPLVLDADDEPLDLSAGKNLDLGGGEDDVFDASSQDPEVTVPPPPPAATVVPTRPAAPAAPQPPAIVFKDEDLPSPASAPRRPVFTDQLPSIAVDRPREASAVPGFERPRAARAAPSPGKLVPIVGALVALLVAGGAAYFGVRYLFRAKPVLTGVAPSRAELGQAITLSGTGFAKSTGSNTVLFDAQKGTVSTATETQLTVVVPTTLDTSAGEVAVSVETGAGRSNTMKVPLRIAPRLTALEPDVALPGADVVIKGHNLDGKNLAVTIANVKAAVKDARPTYIRVEVPRIEGMIEGQGAVVAVQAGGETSRPLTLTLGHLPLLTKVEPLRGEAGDRAVIRGRGFDPDAPANVVTFGGEQAFVVAATEQQLDVIVPALPAPFNVFKAPITVQARGATSGGPFEFTVLRPSSGTFVPRFFPAAVPQDPRRVFISSEAGPLFLLSSADGAASLPERALQVTAALNALFKVGAAPATVEVRGGDPPVVAVAGGSQQLVRATADDAAGYAQPWNAAMKGQRAGAGALAAHWAALLNDYLTLFVLHGRPTHVVEVSPRGKVMLELHAEGERRMGSGGGVPAGLLMPPGPVLAVSMRELALAVPTRSQSVPGAALVGRWSGTMEETDGGPRAFQLRLRLDGTQLAGSFSTRAGQLSMDVPLKAVTYEKGVLSFDVAGGPLKRFRGNASGSTVSGTIADAAQKQIGRFTLQYVD